MLPLDTLLARRRADQATTVPGPWPTPASTGCSPSRGPGRLRPAGAGRRRHRPLPVLQRRHRFPPLADAPGHDGQRPPDPQRGALRPRPRHPGPGPRRAPLRLTGAAPSPTWPSGSPPSAPSRPAGSTAPRWTSRASGPRTRCCRPPSTPAQPHGPPPLWLGALGPRMTALAAELADGLLIHPFGTERHLTEATLPRSSRPSPPPGATAGG